MKKFLSVIVLSMILSSLSFATSNWFVNTELKQDFRYHWQQENKADAAVSGANNDKFTRYRERVRYRIGIESKANDEMNFGLRLATAADSASAPRDPLSTNDTMGESATFSKDQIVFDQAYLKYAPLWFPEQYGKLILEFGKFDVKDGIYTVTDIMWDSDISLEGKNINYNYSFYDGLGLFANLGSYIIQEDTVYDDVLLDVQQLGCKWKITNVYGLEVAAAKYLNPHNNDTGNGINFNERRPIDNQMAKFLIDTMALGLPYVDKVALLWDEYTNTNENERNRGTSSGIEFGTAKLEKLGDWSLRGLNRALEKNCGWTLGDSDVYPKVGGTDTNMVYAWNTKGTEVELKLAVAENAVLGVDQYLIDVIDNDLGNDMGLNKVTQVDINVKF